MTQPAPRMRWIAAAAVFLVVSYACLLFDSGTVHALLQEDGWVEWIGALALFATAGLFFAAFLRARKAPDESRFGRIKLISLLALALLFFVGGGEEISWGQRLLGLSAPEGLAAVNAQDETNLHNLKGLNGILEVNRLFQIFWVAFAVIVPIVCAVFVGARRFAERYIPVLPLWLALLFVGHQVVTEAVQRLLDASPGLYHGLDVGLDVAQAETEISESNVALLFVLGAATVLLSARRDRATGSPEPI